MRRHGTFFGAIVLAATLLLAGFFGPGCGGVTSDSDGGQDATLVCPVAKLETCPLNSGGTPTIDFCTDLQNCGGCRQICLTVANATSVCVAGLCRGTCNGEYHNCNGDSRDGCETLEPCPWPDLGVPADGAAGD